MSIFDKILFFIYSIFIFSACNYNKYKEGILNDSQKIFEKNKNYIYRLSFQGQIIAKKYCDECELNEYILKLQLNQQSEKPIISNEQYQPYYYYENDSILNITVSKVLFDQISENDKIFKEKESFNLIVGKNELLYLNKEKLKWLPR